MQEIEGSASPETGPFSYENWKRASEGVAVRGTFEYPLFTDAHITGTITEGYGPYRLLNTIASPFNVDESRPAIILRTDIHVDWHAGDIRMDRTDETRYHAGRLQDEIVSLVSLCLGIRLRAGGYTRMFQPEGDPKGVPIYVDSHEDPKGIRRSRNIVLPNALGGHSLQKIAPLLDLPKLSAGDAIALIRAARLYQEGLWIAESESQLAWLMFVSAIESSAGWWRRTLESPIDRLQASKPKLLELLRQKGGEEFVSKVAEEIAPYMGATKKFIDFVLEFLPSPPEQRPPEWAQHPWEKKAMKGSLDKIYGYRSRSLHGGIPFPYPMCHEPIRVGDGNVPAEKPIGLAMAAKDAVWMAEDTPMTLHTFEYIARNVLLRWWGSMANEQRCVASS